MTVLRFLRYPKIHVRFLRPLGKNTTVNWLKNFYGSCVLEDTPALQLLAVQFVTIIITVLFRSNFKLILGTQKSLTYHYKRNVSALYLSRTFWNVEPLVKLSQG